MHSAASDQKAGFISLIQRDAMRATLDVATRQYIERSRQTRENLDIADGVMSAIYSHREPAEKLGDRVPPRKAPPRAPTSTRG
jgi:hypothetical protein